MAFGQSVLELLFVQIDITKRLYSNQIQKLEVADQLSTMALTTCVSAAGPHDSGQAPEITKLLGAVATRMQALKEMSEQFAGQS
jgi:hypothetical protein